MCPKITDRWIKHQSVDAMISINSAMLMCNHGNTFNTETYLEASENGTKGQFSALTEGTQD